MMSLEQSRAGVHFGPGLEPAWLDCALAKRATLAPGEVVLLAGAHPMTAAELAARTHRLSRFLLARGVGRDCLVGLYASRSVDQVLGMLLA